MNRISTKALKWTTTVLVAVPIAMMMAGPWVLRKPPRSQAKSYVRKVAAYGGVLAVCAIGAGIGAYAIMKRQTEEYREQSLKNMKDLIEATREDQLRKAGSKKTDATGQDG